MSKITYMIGQGYDASGKPVRNLASKRKDALGTIARTFGGYSTASGQGGWINGKGQLVTEPNLSVTVYTDKSRRLINAVAEQLRNTFGQESVLVASEPARVNFV
jgi:hypothetical protein